MAEKKSKNCGQIYSGIGGQAVIEGIMMKNREQVALGIRKQDGKIVVKRSEYHSLSEKYKFLRLPFLRGILSFGESMGLGMRCLNESASYLEDDEDSEPTKLERWLKGVFGEKLESVLSTVIIVFSFLLAILLFVLFSTYLTGKLKLWISSETVLALLEGSLRVLMFIVYIKLVSRTAEIQRTFAYHGAEHKCINCVEHGLPLTVDNVLLSSKEHKRCGTSFLVYVMLLSILLFMLLRFDTLWMKLLSRLLLIPVIAGVSYEVLRLVGTKDNALTRLLFIPGMWMQGLTTREPDRAQAEVAIAAVEAVFDWRAFLRENFPETEPEAEGETAVPFPEAGETAAIASACGSPMAAAASENAERRSGGKEA